MTLPNRLASGRAVVGLTAREIALSQGSKKDAFVAAQAERAFASAQDVSEDVLPVSEDCTDELLLALSQTFPLSDFGRAATTTPHQNAVALRTASIGAIIDNLRREDHRFLTLVGPSFAQYRRFCREFPNSSITVFQPLTDSRDARRWNKHQDVIADGSWDLRTAVKADSVIALFSAGSIHPADFAEALVVAQASTAYVLHLWSAASLVHETVDTVSAARFSPEGSTIHVSYGDSPGYDDDRAAAQAWLSCDMRHPRHGFFIDVLVQLDSLHVLKINAHPGRTVAQGSRVVDFRDKFHVLPAVDGHPSCVIPTKLWDAATDYASRSNEFVIELQTIRGRIASLKHRVSIGSTVIQEAIFCSDAVADHLAVVVLEFVKLRASLNAEHDRRVERGIAASSLSTAALTHLDQRTCGAVTILEAGARLSINLWTKPARVAYNAGALILTRGNVGACIGRPVDYTPALPAGSEKTLLERTATILDSRPARLDLLSATLRQHFQPTPANASFLRTERVRISKLLAKRARQAHRYAVLIAVSPLPMCSRYFIARTLHAILERCPTFLRGLRQFLVDTKHFIPLGELFADRLYDLLAEYFDWFSFERPEASFVPRFPAPRSAVSSSSNSSSSSSDDDSDFGAIVEEPEITARALSPIEGETKEAALEIPASLECAGTAEETMVVETGNPPAESAETPDDPIVQQGTTEETRDALNMPGYVDAPEIPPPAPAVVEVNKLLLTGAINTNLALNRQLKTNPLDQACPLLPFDKDLVVGKIRKFERLISLKHSRVTVGPNSLKLAICTALMSNELSKFDRSYSQYLQRNTASIRDHGEKTDSRRLKKPMRADLKAAEALLRQIPTPLKKLDALVSGLPAAGKSSILQFLISHDDVIVVPTSKLAGTWSAKLKTWKCRAEVLTQHKILLEPDRKYRVAWIDEAGLFEAIHLHHIAVRADRSVGLGDLSQIRAFHVRKTQAQFPIKPEGCRLWIDAPYSLGLPVDVLEFGIKLGFCPAGSVTLNGNSALELLDDEPEAQTGPKHLNIVFNNDQVTEGFSLTAHSAQGDRPDTAYVRVTNSEAQFVPSSGQFWVALSRATVSTKIYLDRVPALALQEALDASVQGFTRCRTNPIALFVSGLSLVNFQSKLARASLSGSYAEYGMSTVRPEFQVIDVPTAYEVPVHLNPFEITKPEVNDALQHINFNVEGRHYNEIMADANPSVDKELTQPLKVVLDLAASEKHATSTLEQAGVYFASDDTKTEFFTIATRYLSQKHADLANDAAVLADQMLESFETLYIDDKKLLTALDRGSNFTAWLETRNQGTFQPNDFAHYEDSLTLQFSSFLKAHAKAKNDPGFGTFQPEKGQTIAAGSQSYNARFTVICRELQFFLNQASRDNVCFDVGFSDAEYEAFATESQAYAEENTQIDLSSQDSTHFEHHVLMFVKLCMKYTSMTLAEAVEYSTMRSRFTVTAKNFSRAQSIKYEVSWNLPSGDPFTLIANIVHESASLGFAFFLQIYRAVVEERKSLSYKGDDTYAAFLLLLTQLVKERLQVLGVLIKIDHCLPPFFAGRFVLPDNTVHFDYVKVAAKYSVKKHDPTKISEYVMAYRQIVPDLSVYHFEQLVNYALVHHPTLNEQQVRVLFKLALSLKSYAAFLRFQDFSGLSEQFVDRPSDCIRSVFGSLHLPKPERDIGPLQLVTFCQERFIEFHYLPSFTHLQMRNFARAHPNLPIFNDSHALCFLSSTRYSSTSQYL